MTVFNVETNRCAGGDPSAAAPAPGRYHVKRLVAPSALIVAVLATVVAPTALAGPIRGYQITDQANDANGVGAVTPGQAISFSSIDITNVGWSTDRKGRKAKSLVIKMLLAGPVDDPSSPTNGNPGAVYRADATIGSCEFDAVYNVDPVPAVAPTKAIVTCNGSGTQTRPVPVTVGQGSLTWTVRMRAFAKSGLKVGAKLTHLSAHTALTEGGTSLVPVDDASTPASYTVGK